MSRYFANVTLFDGRTVRSKQGVLVAGGTIEWVGAHGRAPRAARAAQEVPGAGRTLAPGLIDCHVHLIFDGEADFEGESRGLTPARAAIKAARNAERHLRAGVTTVRDLGGLDSVVCDVGLAIDEGLTPGPRVLAAGRALTITGGHGHNIGLAREVDSPDDVRRAVREEIKGGARAIKVIATGGVLTPGIDATFTAFTPEELIAAVDEAHKWGRGVAAHAIGAQGILNAVVAGVDSVEHCNQVTPEIAREMKARGTFRSPTLSAILGIVGHPDEVPEYAVKKARALEAESRDGFRRAVRGGRPSRLRDRRGHAVQPARERAAGARVDGRVGDDAAEGDAGRDRQRRGVAAAPARRHRRGGQGGRPRPVRREPDRGDRARAVADARDEGRRRRLRGSEPVKLLVIGGTHFVGRAVVEDAVARETM